MNKTLQVYLPAPKALITQKFGENDNPLYKGEGLKGHSAYDWGMPYGAPIPNCVPDAYCYSNMHVNDPVLMDYRAVFFIVETEESKARGEAYEISYGHLSKHAAVVGKTYQVGEVIGYVGNTGEVYSGTHFVTEAEKRAGSHAGVHLHGPQIRVLLKTKKLKSSSHPLYDENGLLQINGYYFDVPNYNNGYNGCISLAPFSTETLASAYIPPAAIDAQKLVDSLAIATEEVATLPKEQQPGFYAAIANILKGIRDFFSSK